MTTLWLEPDGTVTANPPVVCCIKCRRSFWNISMLYWHWCHWYTLGGQS